MRQRAGAFRVARSDDVPPDLDGDNAGMNGLERVVLLARTARHLRPSQALHRGRLRLQRAAVVIAPRFGAQLLARPVPTRFGWPSAAVPLDSLVTDADQQPPELLAAGSFRFLGENRDLGTPADWRQDGADRLWRFNLQYFEWAWVLHAHPDRDWARTAFARLWQSWHDGTPFGRGDGWAPYVVSLRSWALCGLYLRLVAGSELEDAFLESLVLHAGFIRAHLELDVGGNHLVKNLKALIGLGVFLGDDEMLATACSRLDRQLGIQVLADGGHYERSPSYHCQVLGDLIDVCDLLETAGFTPSDVLTQAVIAMRRWLGAMVMPDGDVPHFNDCGLVGPERVRLLRPTEPTPDSLVVLGPSGYIVVRPAGGSALHLVADVGLPCPPDLPAHAHADCLSFELAVGGQRVIVNAGTSTYSPGGRRAYERSTRAHNTVEVDGADQTEVWSTFRAARRAIPTLDRACEVDGTIEIVASHNGYRRLPGRPVHRRTWAVGPAGLEVVDEVTGGGGHRVVSSVHLVAGSEVSLTGEAAVTAGPLRLGFEGPPGAKVDVVAPGTNPDGWAATGFGHLQPAPTVRVSADGVLPLRLSTTIAMHGDGGRNKAPSG